MRDRAEQGDATAPSDMRVPLSQSGSPDDDGPTAHLSIHQGSLDPLLDRGGHAQHPTELVVTPGDLHRRTIKHRFERAKQPRDTIDCVEPADIAERVLVADGGTTPTLLDRVDRIPLLEALLQEMDTATAMLARVLGTAPQQTVSRVERARTAIETTTGYHPVRIAGLRDWCADRETPVAADCRDLLAGVLAVERQLRAQTDHATSQGMLVRQVCRTLRECNGRNWGEAFPTIERLWLCGVTTLSATLADLVAAIGTATAVELHLHTRPVSGALLRDRLPEIFAVPDPGREVFTE